MDSKEQLRLWLEGKPAHMGDPEDGQCCPDFSCCGGMMAPIEEREEFVRHYREHDEPPMGMMMTFLSRMLERKGVGHKVHIAGRGEVDRG